MKDRILNTLMLCMAALALALTLIRDGQTEPASPALAPVQTEAPDPLAAYRARRAEDRQRQTQALLALIQGEDEETGCMARDMLLQMQRENETELAVEALLTGKGYGDALCVADEKELLLVMKRTLTGEEAEALLRLTAQVSGYPMQNIRITC